MQDYSWKTPWHSRGVGIGGPQGPGPLNFQQTAMEKQLRHDAVCNNHYYIIGRYNCVNNNCAPPTIFHFPTPMRPYCNWITGLKLICTSTKLVYACTPIISASGNQVTINLRCFDGQHIDQFSHRNWRWHPAIQPYVSMHNGTVCTYITGFGKGA